MFLLFENSLIMNDQLFTNLYSSFIWKFIGFLFLAVLFALALGMVIGLFTYGKPLPKKKKSDGILDDYANLGIEISHMLIGIIIRKMTGKATTANQWLTDRGLLGSLKSLHPSEFEEFMARFFELVGYRVTIVGGSHDGGIDLEMEKNGLHYVVQCKKYITTKVNVHEMRDFFGALAGHHVDGKGFFVTTNIFTLEAEQFAEDKPIELIDGSKLVALIRKQPELLNNLSSSVVISNSFASNDICPKCGSKLVERRNHQNGKPFLGCSNFPNCHFTKPV